MQTTKAKSLCSLIRSILQANAVLETIEFHWFYKGMPITVRFSSWRRGQIAFEAGRHRGILRNSRNYKGIMKVPRRRHALVMGKVIALPVAEWPDSFDFARFYKDFGIERRRILPGALRAPGT